MRSPLRIRGARIVGPIRALPTSREGSDMTLLFWSCQFDSTVDFSGAELLALRLVDCTLPAFIGISLTVKADWTCLDPTSPASAATSPTSRMLAIVRST